MESSTWYALEHIDDGVGEGFRLYTSQNEAYESRKNYSAESRIYGEEGSWNTKVRFPITDEIEGYDRFTEVADAIEAEYGVDLHLSALHVNDRLEDGDHVRSTGPDMEIGINQEDHLPVETSNLLSYDKLRNMSVPITGYGAAGGTVGLALGLPEAVPILVGIGAITGEVDYLLAKNGSGKTGTALANRLWKKRQERTARRGNALDTGLLDELNEKNRLGRVMNEEDSLEERDRYNDLRDKDLDETLDDILNTHFRGLNRTRGVYAETMADTYEDAVTFVETVQELPDSTLSTPSIYTDAEIFNGLLRHTTYHHNAEENVLPEGRQLIEEALQRSETTEDVLQVLNDEYEKFLDEVGTGGLP